MSRGVIGFESITYALKAKNILAAEGIVSEVLRADSEENSCGCGYSLMVYRHPARAMRILEENGIRQLGFIN